jgi:ferrous iron transport protein A
VLHFFKQFLTKERESVLTVVGFKDQQIASKLLSVGILPGSQLQIVRRAPGGFVYYLKVDGISIALRQNELQSIILEKQTNS